MFLFFYFEEVKTELALTIDFSHSSCIYYTSCVKSTEHPCAVTLHQQNIKESM